MRNLRGRKEVVEMAEFIRNGLLLKINTEFASLERARQRVLNEETGEWFLKNQYNDPRGIADQYR